MAITQYKFGEFNPDTGPYFGEGEGFIDLMDCRNVLSVPEGYAISDNFRSLGNALGTQTHAAARIAKSLYSYLNASGDNEWLYQNATKVHQITASGTTVVDISRAGDYNTSADFKYTKFGPTLIATNGVDAIQRGAIGATLAKNNVISGTPAAADPRARFIEKFKGHLFLGYIDLTVGSSGTGPETYGGAFGPLLAQAYPEMIWHSALNNERRFGSPDTTPAILGSDFRRFYDDLGAVTGLKASNDYLAVFRERGVGIVSGPPFNFDIISEHHGCSLPNSIVRSGSDIYFWSSSGPAVILGGQEVKLIAESKVNKWVSEVWTNIVGSGFVGATRSLSAAVTVDGKFVVWTIKRPYQTPTWGLGLDVIATDATYNYNYFLVYSVYDDTFTLCTEGELGTFAPITSYHKKFNDHCRFAGISGLGNILNTIGPNLGGSPTGGDFLAISEYEGLAAGGALARNYSYLNAISSYTDTAPNSYPSIKTKYIKFPIGDENPAFKFSKVKPILYVEGNRGFTNQFGNLVREVRVYPRGRYEGRDKPLFGEEAPTDTAAETYESFTSQDADGWFSTDGAPYANLNALEFIFNKDYNIRLIYGFECILDDGSAYSSSGKELTAI